MEQEKQRVYCSIYASPASHKPVVFCTHLLPDPLNARKKLNEPHLAMCYIRALPFLRVQAKLPEASVPQIERLHLAVRDGRLPLLARRPQLLQKLLEVVLVVAHCRLAHETILRAQGTVRVRKAVPHDVLFRRGLHCF